MSGKRALVTGMGMTSSLGADTSSTASQLFSGERKIGKLSLFDTEGYASHLAAEAAWLDAYPARSDWLATLAATEALREAGVDPRTDRIELIVAASLGGMFESEVLLTRGTLGEAIELPTDLLRHHPHSAPADAIVRALGPGAFARITTVCSACSSGTLALGLAQERIQRGQAEVVLAGGVDALARLTFTGFSALASLDRLPCRPFDRDRAGLTLGEGAAFLVLEASDRARSRGARVRAELVGFATRCEAHHVTQPEESGATAELVMRRALERGGVPAAEVAHVSAHGTGTPRNDAMEAHAIQRVMPHGMPVSSTKAQLGHTLAAAGAFSAAVCVLAVERGLVPPSVGVEHPDPDLPITLAPSRASVGEVPAALANAFGFGGNDASLVVARPGRHAPAPAGLVEPLMITAAAALGPLGLLANAEAAAYADDARAVDLAAGLPEVSSVAVSASRTRSDLVGRQTIALVERVLEGAVAAGRSRDASDVGVVVGAAFPACDASGAFYGRVLTKGARFASPAAFPGLVPSAQASSASIALGARGPSMAVTDLGLSAFTALETASDLLHGGHAQGMVACAIEPESRMVERWLAEACTRRGDGPRGSGGAAFQLSLASAGAPAIARVEQLVTWRGAAPSLRAPRPRAEVIVADRDATRALAVTLGWGEVRALTVGPRTGWHEAAVGVALAAAVGRLASGAIDEALVLASFPDRSGLCLLVRA